MSSSSPFRSPVGQSTNGVHPITGSSPDEALRRPNSETLKIVVVGTPKTGNTWVKHILAETYGLPLVKLKPEFDLAEVEAAGSRWISHQHFLPSEGLLAWGATRHVVFVCPVRHPGDVLVSLWHHVRNRRAREKHDTGDYTESKSMLRDETEVVGQHTRRFVELGFHYYLNLSIAWFGLPGVRAVRYEDLWECPVESLRALTSSILPVSEERLRLALCACELGLMQNLMDPAKKFLRQGGTGGWRAALPNDIKRLFSSLDPYPAQFAALGYTMDEEDPVNAPQPEAGIVVGPFGRNRTFANGIPVAPMLMKAYFDLPRDKREHWSDPRSTAEDSFFNWLNRPAAADPRSTSATAGITELAYYLYISRPDLVRAFPDVFGAHRAAYYVWFLENARQEYGLDRCFVPDSPFAPTSAFDNGVPVAGLVVRVWFDLPPSLRARWADPRHTGPDSFYAWLTSPAESDPVADDRPAIVSELAAYVHSIRPDLAATFPDLFGHSRLAFVEWFIINADKEYGLDHRLVRTDPFTGFAASADSSFDNGVPAPRLVARAWFNLSPRLRLRWPDPRRTGPDSFFAWLTSPAASDPLTSDRPAIITELAAYLYSIRPDIAATFPDVFGRDRLAFVEWFIVNAQKEYSLDDRLARTDPFTGFAAFSDGTRVARILVRAYLDLPESRRQQWPQPAANDAGPFLAWLNSPASADPTAGALAPAITELGAYLHSIRPDVRQQWPDLYGKNRVDFAQWFLSSAMLEYELDRAFTLPVVRSWAQSVDRVPPHICKLLRQRQRTLKHIAH